MPGYTDFAKNAMLDSLTIQEVSLHSSNPGSAGDNELDDSGIYERQSITLLAASAGERSTTDDVVFDVPAGETVAFVGFWNDTGDFLGSTQVASETFSSDGTYTLTSTTLDLNLEP